MAFDCIKTQGPILSPDYILRLAEEGENSKLGQAAKDFELPPRARVRDHVAAVWGELLHRWEIFKARRARLPEGDSGAALTRKEWLMPLLAALGFQPTKAAAVSILDKSFAISHIDERREGLPLHLMGCNDLLDKKRELGGPRVSPHGLVQEYLNLAEHLYGIVSNGLSLRILRDSNRMLRLTFVEFDLERMFDGLHFADFALMFRLLHATRFPAKAELADDCWLERYHISSLEQGARVRDQLSLALENAIVELAQELLRWPENGKLRTNIQEYGPEKDGLKFFQLLLDFFYRVIFLYVVEERDLLFTDEADAKHREWYREHYSATRFRLRAMRPELASVEAYDLWLALLETLVLLEDPGMAQAISLRPIATGLFAPDKLGVLQECRIGNRALLRVLRHFSLFRAQKDGPLVPINYRLLDSEEIGSIYQNILERKPWLGPTPKGLEFRFEQGDERSRTGTHYTPEVLAKPLVQHSLPHLFQQIRLRLALPELPATPQDRQRLADEILRLRVCDIAAGSGHLLINAARAIGFELARVRTGEEQPAPKPLREAIRDVIQHCIFGVDRNPMAVELCKISLWLEAHVPGMPLNFLDHRIKTGDSVVGFASPDELYSAFPRILKKLPGDDNAITTRIKKRIVEQLGSKDVLLVWGEGTAFKTASEELRQRYGQWQQMPEHSPEQVHRKEAAYKTLKQFLAEGPIQLAADWLCSAFFWPKTPDMEKFFPTPMELQHIGTGDMSKQIPGKVDAMASKHRFFHWFLEFPEIIDPQNPKQLHGFDLLIGNPPFLGGLKISSLMGDHYLNFLHQNYEPAGGTCDFVVYFMRRAYQLARDGGFVSQITSNTVAQGDSRTGGLDFVLQQGGSIAYALPSTVWPGAAAVHVSIFSLFKGKWEGPATLRHRSVSQISSYLDEGGNVPDPVPLVDNQSKGFIGSFVLGMDFMLDDQDREDLLSASPHEERVIQPYLNGQDLNSRPDQSPSRWVINFRDWPLRRAGAEEWAKLPKKEKTEIEERSKQGRQVEMAPPDHPGPVAEDFPLCLQRVRELVKPERDVLKMQSRRERWWIYGSNTPSLIAAIKKNQKVLVTAIVTKTHAFTFVDAKMVFTNKLVVFSYEDFAHYAVLQSSAHEHWAWKYSSTMKNDRRYAPSNCFETFTFPWRAGEGLPGDLEALGRQHHDLRAKLCRAHGLGLTELWNLYHSEALPSLRALTDAPQPPDPRSEKPKELDKRYGRAISKLLRELWEKLPPAQAQAELEDLLSGLLRLRRLLAQMDQAVFEAYGWHDLAPDHGLHELEYLPAEGDNQRYTIGPQARREALARLLALNAKRHRASP